MGIRTGGGIREDRKGMLRWSGENMMPRGKNYYGARFEETWGPIDANRFQPQNSIERACKDIPLKGV